MKRVVVLLWLFVCLFIIAGVGHASPITFELFSSGRRLEYTSPEEGPLRFFESVVSLDVTAENEDGIAIDIARNENGLGCYSGGSDSKDLDGSGRDEILSFDFGQTMHLQKIYFSLAAAGDKFSLGIDRGDFGSPRSVLSIVDITQSHLTGEVFSFRVGDGGGGCRIWSVVAEAVDTPIPAPEPATWLLFGGGLCGFVWWRKNKIE